MQRKQWPDVLKGIAVLLMMQVHVTALFLRQSLQSSYWGEWSWFFGGVPAAPLFMLIMGFFVAKSTHSSGYHIRRGLRLIVLGLLLNVLMNINLLIHIAFYGWLVSPWAYIFGVDILPLAGMGVILLTLLHKLFKNQGWLYLVLAGIIAFASPYMTSIVSDSSWLKYVEAFLWGDEYWGYFSLFPWLSWPLAGFAVAKMPPRVYRFVRVYGWILIFPLGWYFAEVFQMSHHIYQYYHHGLVLFFWGMSFYIVLFSLGSFLIQILPSLNVVCMSRVAWLGRHVTAIYIVQWIILGNLSTLFYQKFSWTGWLFVLVATVTFSVFIVQKMNYFQQKQQALF